MAVPVFIQASMREANAAAASACVAWLPASSEATPSGAAGGTPAKVGSMPAATVVAKAVKAASNAAAAEGLLNAEVSAPTSVAAAAATVVEAGTMLAA